jgi:hypothetical protein
MDRTCQLNTLSVWEIHTLMYIIDLESIRARECLGSMAFGANVDVLLDIHAKGWEALRIMYVCDNWGLIFAYNAD